MLELRDFMPISFLKKEKPIGGHDDMRSRMKKLNLGGEDGPRLSVTVRPKPYSYGVVPEGEKEQQILSFNTDDIARGVGWLSEQFESQRIKWRAVSRD